MRADKHEFPQENSVSKALACDEILHRAFKRKKDAHCGVVLAVRVLLCENRPFPKKSRLLYPPPCFSE